jgi:hypothetical protein
MKWHFYNDFKALNSSMFNLFRGSKPSVKVIDKVWMSKVAKLNACRQMLAVNPSCLFIAWFEETANEFQHALENSDCVLLAQKVDPTVLREKMIVFAEHYPLGKKEEALFLHLNLKEVPVLSSLDEALFMQFGGERTIELMRKLGMNEDEVIGHAMITKAIHNAQAKLEKKVVVEKLASSAKEWFEVNLG